MSDRTRLGGRKLALSILFDTVTLEVICGDDYEANVLYEDLLERLQKGEKIELSIDAGSLEDRP